MVTLGHTDGAAGRRLAAGSALATAMTLLASCGIEQMPAQGATGATANGELQATPAGRAWEPISPPGVARLPVFSSAARVGNVLYLSGAIGTEAESLQLVEGGVGPETRQTLANIQRVLEASGATLQDVFKCTVFLADIADYADMNAAYVEFFPEDPPARSAMAGSGLALGARVEIECMAALPE